MSRSFGFARFGLARVEALSVGHGVVALHSIPKGSHPDLGYMLACVVNRWVVGCTKRIYRGR
jgi:hypothetical protein